MTTGRINQVAGNIPGLLQRPKVQEIGPLVKQAARFCVYSLARVAVEPKGSLSLSSKIISGAQ